MLLTLVLTLAAASSLFTMLVSARLDDDLGKSRSVMVLTLLGGFVAYALAFAGAIAIAPDRPLYLASAAAALIGLGICTVTDLRPGRWVYAIVPRIALAVCLPVGLLDSLLNHAASEPVAAWRPLIGAGLLLAISGVVYLFGRFYGEFRNLPDDEETNERMEAFGREDVILWTLAGAIMPVPVGVSAFVVAMILFAIVAIPAQLHAMVTHRWAVLPHVPAISVAVLFVLLRII
jgi:hypothetical protein